MKTYAPSFTTVSLWQAFCDTAHAVTESLDRGVNDLIESKRLRLLGFRMIGRA